MVLSKPKTDLRRLSLRKVLRRRSSKIDAFPLNSVLPREEASIPVDVPWEKLTPLKLMIENQRSLIYKSSFSGNACVIKTVNTNYKYLQNAAKDLENELSILQMLGNSHENIIHLLGAGYTPDGYRFLVLEYLEYGTLTEKIFETSNSQIDLENVLENARSLADAMNYCHTVISKTRNDSMVIHRDLKPDNIGFTIDGKLKVFDFGISRILKKSSSSVNEVYNLTGGLGTLRFMPPEVANHECYNEKADVYSFGIILWEMLSMKEAFEDVDEKYLLDEVIDNDLRPKINDKWPKSLSIIMEKCWSKDIEDRPSFKEILSCFDLLARNQ